MANKAFSFPGANADYIGLGAWSSYGFGDITMECWVKPHADALSGHHNIMGINKNDGPYDFRGILRLYNGKPFFSLWINSNNVGTGTPANALTAGVWYHLCATYDGYATNTKLQMYVDADLVGESSAQGTGVADHSSFERWIGYTCNDTGCAWKGLIDEPRFWQSVMSQAQVDDLYNAGAGYEGDPGFGTLAAGYHADDDALDYSGHSLNGTLQGSVTYDTGKFVGSVGPTPGQIDNARDTNVARDRIVLDRKFYLPF